MEITWLGHGSFQFRLPSGQVILMDPWIDGNPAYPKAHTIEQVDTICISHGHFDHIHDTPPLAKRFSPEVVGIFETCAWLESKGVKNTRAMNKGGSQKVGDVTFRLLAVGCGLRREPRGAYGRREAWGAGRGWNPRPADSGTGMALESHPCGALSSSQQLDCKRNDSGRKALNPRGSGTESPSRTPEMLRVWPVLAL